LNPRRGFRLEERYRRDDERYRRDDEYEGYDDACIMHRPGLNIELQCAQELFSLFILAVASRVSEVGGATRVVTRNRVDSDFLEYEFPGSRDERRMGVLDIPTPTNTVFTAIASEAVDAGIARDMDEACKPIKTKRSV